MKGNRVDHPRKLSKDLADAVCGAIFGAISHTPRNMNEEVEIHQFRDKKPEDKLFKLEEENKRNVIHAPKREVQEYLEQFNFDVL